MITSVQELVHVLRTRGLIADGVAGEVSAQRITDRPWYISLLLGASGWIAGIFLLVFVFLLFRPDSPGVALFTGLVLLSAAGVLFIVDREGAFVSQLALALSVAGQFALLFGISDSIFKLSRSFAGIAFSAFILQLVLIGVMPNRLHRIMSTVFACAAWAIVVRYGLWDESVWGQMRSAGPNATPSLPLAVVSWAIVWLPAGGLLYLLIRNEPAWMARGWQTLLRPVSVGLIVGLAAATLLSHPFDSFSLGLSIEHRQNWLALWPMFSALASLAALAAAFALGSRWLTGACVVAVLLHVSHFYYAMGTTLLIKSMTMLVLGALLLGWARFLKRRDSL